MVTYKTEIVSKLATKLGIKNSEARNVLLALEEIISEELENGNSVRTSLGTFATRDTAGYTRYNGLVGRNITVPAGKAISFKASTQLKRRVN